MTVLPVFVSVKDHEQRNFRRPNGLRVGEIVPTFPHIGSSFIEPWRVTQYLGTPTAAQKGRVLK